MIAKFVSCFVRLRCASKSAPASALATSRSSDDMTVGTDFEMW